jgi:hypothetical protein
MTRSTSKKGEEVEEEELEEDALEEEDDLGRFVPHTSHFADEA